MSARRVEVTLSQDVWDWLEAARGHEPRASFVKRALEKALGNERGDTADDLGVGPRSRGESGATNSAAALASSRASETKPKAYRSVVQTQTGKPSKLPPGLRTGGELLAERQARLNAEREKKR